MSKEPDTTPPLIDRIGDGLSRVATAMRTEAWSSAEAIGLNPTVEALGIQFLVILFTLAAFSLVRREMAQTRKLSDPRTA